MVGELLIFDFVEWFDKRDWFGGLGGKFLWVRFGEDRWFF